MPNIVEIYHSSGSIPCRKTDNEFAGKCPCCGGEDRFLLWLQARNSSKFPEGNFYCRQCGISGGPDKLRHILNSTPNSVAPASRFTPAKSFFKTNSPLKTAAAPQAITHEDYLRIVEEARQMLQKSSPSILLAQNYLKTRGIDPLWAASKFDLGFIAFTGQYTPLGPAEKLPRTPIGISIPSYRNGQLVSVKVRTLTGDADNNNSYHSKFTLLKGCPQVPYILRLNELSTTPILIVESELDAILLAQHSAQLFNYIALGSTSTKPDTDVVQMIRSASKVYFCPDYDTPGMEAFERWRKTFSKIQLTMLPKGKDPTEAWEAGVDLKAWTDGLRMGTASPLTSREQKFQYTAIESHDALCSFLQSLRAMDCKRIAVEYDQAHDLIAFSDGDRNTAVGSLEGLCVDWSKDMGDFTLVTFDSALLYRDIPSLRHTKVHSLHALFHALTGDGKGMELAELSSKYLGYRGGLPDFGSTKTFSAERIIAGNVRAVAALTPMVQGLPKNEAANKYYALLRDSSKSLGEIMEHGLLIDREAFEKDGGPKKARDIWAHRDEDGRVRGHFSSFGAVTGRTVCTIPNLQSFPNELKHTVIAPHGRMLIDADYRQSEMRIAAILAMDEAMLSSLQEGKDIHRETASRVLRIPFDSVCHEQRQIGKAVNFGFLYGQTAKGLQATLAELEILRSIEECYELQNVFVSCYPSLSRWRDQSLQVCSVPDRKKTVSPPTGVRTALRRHIPVYTLDFRHKAKVVNYIVQGTGAELTLQVLSLLPERLAELDAKIIHCIHDEFLIEAAEENAETAAAILTQTMTDAFVQLFPGVSTNHLVDCGIGTTWAEAKGA